LFLLGNRQNFSHSSFHLYTYSPDRANLLGRRDN
jgi:hypothetical protein